MSFRLSAADVAALERAIDESDSHSRYRISVSCIDANLCTRHDRIVVLVDPFEARRIGPRELVTRYSLTSREIEAAQLVRNGLSSRAIAKTLGISVNTARRHVEHVLSKLGVHSRTAAAARLNGD